MPVNLTTNEEEQILQTIEMFEVIAQTNPDDYQALSLLREAYQKLGRTEEVLRTSQLLGEAYVHSGQYKAALQEYDFILSLDSSSETALNQQRQLHTLMQDDKGEPFPEDVEILPDDSLSTANVSQDITPKSSLIISSDTEYASQVMDHALPLPKKDGTDALAQFIRSQQIVTEDELQAAILRVRNAKKKKTNKMALSLLEEVLRDSSADKDAIYADLLDAAKIGYVPLENYEIDRHVLRMLPDEYTLERLFVPFDLFSRTILIAMCDPFDLPGREVVQQSIDYNIQWYFATPEALRNVLKDTYKIKE